MFSDRRVREAITLAFDFEWMNKALFYNARSRTNSYFQNTEYAARGYPDADELVILAPLKKSCHRKSSVKSINHRCRKAMVTIVKTC